MKAVRLVEPGRPLQMQNVPRPMPAADEVLVRVMAAGICRSDMHYRAGVSPVRPLPLTLGHEVAGVVEAVGSSVRERRPGERVCLHYLVACGQCGYCRSGREQFCPAGSMIGKYCDGGFAEFIAVPARNAVPLPDEIPFEHGAVLMCSSATSYHALRRGGARSGERVAVFGVGGLGMSAVQLARALGAAEVFAVELDPAKLALAKDLGAVPVDNRDGDAPDAIRRRTDGQGADVVIELTGRPATIQQAVETLTPGGRLVLVALSGETVVLHPYRDIIGREMALIGAADHLADELPPLIDFVRRGTLDLSRVLSGTVPLDADAINDTLDRLERFEPGLIRTVVTPTHVKTGERRQETGDGR
jgi:propanol-preferring alcohol dehydrogenase